MQLITIDDQEKIILQFEKEYCHLLKNYKQGNIKHDLFAKKALSLAAEIRSTALPKFFTEEKVVFLQELSASITQQFDSSQLQQQRKTA